MRERIQRKNISEDRVTPGHGGENAIDHKIEEQKKERQKLLEAIARTDRVNAKEYSEKFLSFLAYQNGRYHDIHEFSALENLQDQLQVRGLTPKEREDRIARERLEIYQKEIVGPMLQIERALDPKEAKQIRDETTATFNLSLQRRGIQPKLRPG